MPHAAFGTGSSIARGAVGAAGDALFGGSASDQAAQPAVQQAAAAPAAADASCAVDKHAFYQCLSLAVSASTNDRVFSSMAWKSTLISHRETSNGDADKCKDLFSALSMCQENAKWASA